MFPKLINSKIQSKTLKDKYAKLNNNINLIKYVRSKLYKSMLQEIFHQFIL